MAGNTKTGTITKKGLVVGRGNNRTVIDPEDVKKLARLHVTIKEMAEYFGTTSDTISYHFADIITKAKIETKNSLRRAQLKVAYDGNPTMLIWLGKQLLSQSENPMNNDDTNVLPWNDD
tara:strand:+ start:607 stop:963 length:357 start_codon:yes stop_codon:yes gene_type:complete